MKSLVLVVFLRVSVSLAADTGRLEVIGKDSVDFGKYPAIEKKVATYQIKNSGTGKLVILNVRKTCGCASATCDKKVLETNEHAKVEVTILPNSIFGLFSKNTFIESTDPNNRFLRLTVAGNSIPLLDVKPSLELYAGRLKTNAEWSQSFSLTGAEPGITLGDPQTESNYKVTARLTKTGKTGESRFDLNITLLPSFESGDFKCVACIPVICPSNNPPTKIVITGRVGTELSAVPGIVYLRFSNEPQTRKFTLRVLGDRTKVLKTEDLILPKNNGTAFNFKPDLQGHSLEVTATFNSNFIKELYAEESIPLEFKMAGASSAAIVCKINK